MKFRREFWAGDEHLEVANMYREGLTEKIRGPRIEPWGSPSLGVGVGRFRRSQQKRGSGLGSKRKPGMLACWKSGEEAL